MGYTLAGQAHDTWPLAAQLQSCQMETPEDGRRAQNPLLRTQGVHWLVLKNKHSATNGRYVTLQGHVMIQKLLLPPPSIGIRNGAMVQQVQDAHRNQGACQPIPRSEYHEEAP